jgi:hypothetical protein
MPEFPEVDQLDEAAVEEAYDYLVELLYEQAPELNPETGAVANTICRLQAIQQASIMHMVERINRGVDINDIAAAENDTAVDVLDELAERHGISRVPGSRSVIEADIYLTRDRMPLLQDGDKFFVNETDDAFYIFKEFVGQLREGTYGDQACYVITARFEAVTRGPLPEANSLTPVNGINNYIDTVITRCILPGTLPESNRSLVRRISSRKMLHAAVTPWHIRNLIQNNNFCGLAELRVHDIAIAVPGMSRRCLMENNKGILMPSRSIVDVYVMTSTSPVPYVQNVIFHATADRRQPDPARYTRDYAYMFEGAQAAGVYSVEGVSFQSDEALRDCPQITAISALHRYNTEASSSYRGTDQTMSCCVVAAATTIEALPEELPLQVVMQRTPGIAEIQAFMDSDDVRVPGVNIIVQPPAFCSLFLRIELIGTDHLDADLGRGIAHRISAAITQRYGKFCERCPIDGIRRICDAAVHAEIPACGCGNIRTSGELFTAHSKYHFHEEPVTQNSGIYLSTVEDQTNNYKINGAFYADWRNIAFYTEQGNCIYHTVDI